MRPIVTELTGKRWKLGMVLFVAVMLLGGCWGWHHPGSTDATLTLGMVLFIGGVVCAILAWWYHG